METKKSVCNVTFGSDLMPWHWPRPPAGPCMHCCGAGDHHVTCSLKLHITAEANLTYKSAFNLHGISGHTMLDWNSYPCMGRLLYTTSLSCFCQTISDALYSQQHESLYSDSRKNVCMASFRDSAVNYVFPSTLPEEQPMSKGGFTLLRSTFAKTQLNCGFHTG